MYTNKLVLVLTVLAVYVQLSGVTPTPFICDAATATTGPAEGSGETVKNLNAEVIYCEEMDFDGEWTPYEDVALSWEPTPSGEETAYEIWFTAAPDTYELLDTIDSGATEYTDHFVYWPYDEPIIISYKIRPLFGDLPGLFSEIVTVKK